MGPQAWQEAVVDVSASACMGMYELHPVRVRSCTVAQCVYGVCAFASGRLPFLRVGGVMPNPRSQEAAKHTASATSSMTK